MTVTIAGNAPTPAQKQDLLDAFGILSGADVTAAATASEVSRQASGVSAGQAAAAKTQAETARDVALSASVRVYADTANALLVTTSGQVFHVPHATLENTLVRYANVAGAAVNTGRRYNQATGAEIGTAVALINDEVEGLAIDVTTDDLGEQLRVVDMATPANNYQGPLLNFVAATCFPGAKMVTLKDGTIGWSDHNLFYNCERPDSGNWVPSGMTSSAPADGMCLLTATSTSSSTWQGCQSTLRGYYYTATYIGKAGTAPYSYIRSQVDGVDLYAYFNLANGTVGSADAGVTHNIYTTEEDGVTPLAAGEYRMVATTKISTSAVISIHRIHYGLANADASTLVDVGRTGFFRRSMMNFGVRPTGYIVTTAGARYGIPYDWSKGARRVLIESLSVGFPSRYADDLTQAAFWSATNCTPTLAATGPHGQPCSVLTATAANATILQSFTSSQATNSFQARIKRRVGTGAVSMTLDGGTTWIDVSEKINTSTYTLAYINSSGSSAINFGFKLSNTGDAIDVALAVVGASSSNAPITSPVPTYDPGSGSINVRPADVFRIPTTKFHLGSEFTFFCDFEISGDSAASVEQAGVRGLSDSHSIIRNDSLYVSRSSAVGGVYASNFLNDSPKSLRVEGAMRIKANDIAGTANGGSELYDQRVGVGSITEIFAGSAGGQLFLRRILLVPRSVADDALQNWRYSTSGADPRYLADIKVAKMGEIANTHICREPSVEVIRDEADYALLSVAFMQRYITQSPDSGESPSRIMRSTFKFNKTNRSLVNLTGQTVVAQQANWTSSLGHLQGPTQIKIKYGPMQGRLLIVYGALDTLNGRFDPDWRRLYCQSSDDNGLTLSAPVMIFDPGAGKYALTTGSGAPVQIMRGANAGRIVIPVYTNQDGNTRPAALYSDDSGASWVKVSILTTGGEPSLHLLPDGITLVMTMRQESAPWRTYVSSVDGGASWGASAYMDAVGAEGTNVAMAIVQSDPLGGNGRYGQQLLVGVRKNTYPYQLRSKLTVEEVVGPALLASGDQFCPLGVYRPCGYTAAARVDGGYLAIAYESSPTGVTNNGSDVRLMVVSLP